MICASELSVATAVGGCGWPISVRAVYVEVVSSNFSNSPPNSDPAEEATTLCIILYSKCMGPFYWGISKIAFLWFKGLG